MKDSRMYSLILLVIAILIATSGIVYYCINTYPQTIPLGSTIDILRTAKDDTTLELKLADTAKALEAYQTGVSQQNLEGLKLLMKCNSTHQFDYLLPQIEGQIRAERDNITFNLHAMMQDGLVFSFIVASAVGTLGDYEDWSTDEKHGYIAIQFALILAITVSFIP